MIKILRRKIKIRLRWGNTGPPTKLILNGKLLTIPARIARAMNTSFFLTKVSTMDPLEKLREVMEGRQCSFSVWPVKPDELEK